MKREIIERLAIDSAAWELNEDTEALFRAYLYDRPEANQWAEDMLQIYRMTEVTIQTKTKTALADITQPIKVKPQRRLNWLQITRWAAVVVFAACIGVVAGRWSKSDITTQRPRIVAGAPDLTEQRPVRNLRNIDSGFWRDKAVAMLSVKPHSINGVIIQSNGLWDRYRQYVKEKYNE
jgi:hypothetical protein